MVLFMDKKTVVLRVKLRRVSRGLSQEDLASAIGIDASQYSRIESGASDLNLTKLIKIMEKLEMKFSDFDDDDGTELPSTNTELEIRKLRADMDKILNSLKDEVPKKKLKMKDVS
jgi:transcriptional regulator with XRE-family HTH domain